MAKSKLDQLRERARKEIASLGEVVRAGELPIDLRPLAKAEKIGAVRFRPILGTAGLLKTADGYDIVVNTEAPGAKHPPEAVYDLNSPVWNDFPSPIRFTVTHEIVHLILVRLSGGDPNKDIFSRNEEALDHLSNELASSILIPARQLVKEIGEKLFAAEHLSRVAQAFRVSPEALARRLHSTDVRKRFEDASGLVGYVREETEDEDPSVATFRLVAGAIWGVPARHQFGIGGKRPRDLFDGSDFPAGHSLRDLRLDVDLADMLNSKMNGSSMVNAIWRSDSPRQILRCELQFQRTREKPVGLFLTIRVLEGPIDG